MLPILLAPLTAHALDPQWTVGGHVGTTFLPGGYPIGFPPRIRSYDFNQDGGLADDVNGDGVPDETSLEKVHTDGILGASGSYWITGGSRVGLLAQADLGQRFTEVSAIGIYNQTFDFDALYVLAGGGVGFASSSWRGLNTMERLRVPGYPLRAEGGVLVPINDFMGIEAKLFAQMDIPARHTYRDLAGQDHDISGVPFTYTALGLEVGFDYGQLR